MKKPGTSSQAFSSKNDRLCSFCFLIQGDTQGLGQLVRTGGGLIAALNPCHAGDGVLGLHARQQLGNALEVAAAASQNLDLLNHAFLDFHVHKLGAYALGFILNGQWSSSFLSVYIIMTS